MNISRAQYLYKEGTPITHVYIIKAGEFKIMKKIIVLDREESQQQDPSEVFENPIKAKKVE